MNPTRCYQTVYLSCGVLGNPLPTTHNTDPVPIVLVLQSLYDCNRESRIVPEFMFYNEAVSKTVNILKEWRDLKALGAGSTVFNWCRYPFLLNTLDKAMLSREEAKRRMDRQMNTHVNRYPSHESFLTLA